MKAPKGRKYWYPALKTNLLLDAVTAVNAEIEFPIGKHFSILVEDIFPWWSWGPILAKHEVNVEYIPSGIDIISLVVESKKVSKCLYAMLGELQKEVQPNKITVTEHIAVVAAVGRKMAYRPGVSGKIFAKLGENGVNIRMITQGPEELNIIVGVEEKDFEIGRASCRERV